MTNCTYCRALIVEHTYLREIVSFVSLNQCKMEKAAIKEAMMQSLSAEIDLWLDKQQNLTSGYEYETEFMKVAQKVNKIHLEKSLDTPVNGSRNQKKNCNLPG